MLHMPSGGVLVLIYLAMLEQMEEMTGLPTRVLFPICDTASGGSVLAGMLYGPNPVSAKEARRLFRTYAQQFLTPQENRLVKMLVANGIYTLRDYLDPKITDSLRLKDISNVCDEMRGIANQALHETIKTLENLATRQWPKQSDNLKVYRLCESLRAHDAGLTDLSDVVLAHVGDRVKERTGLRSIFNQAAIAAGNLVTRKWAKDYLYDARVQKDVYDSHYQGARISDGPGTVFMCAHDTLSNSKISFHRIKADLLNPDCIENQEVSEGNDTCTDAVMSASQNQLAFMPHKMRNGKMLTNDCGAWHSYSENYDYVQALIRMQRPDARLDLCILTTGNNMLEVADLEREEQRQREIGLPGALADGSQLARIGGNIMSSAKFHVARMQRINHGVTNGILEINPRSIARTYEEYCTFPSINPLDASDRNMRDIDLRSEGVKVENHHEIVAMAQRAVENLHSCDYLSDHQYLTIMKRIAEFPVPQMQTPQPAHRRDLFDEIRRDLDNQFPARMSRRVSSIADSVKARFIPAARAANDDIGVTVPPEIDPQTPESKPPERRHG